jgi:hypothetical protein
VGDPVTAGGHHRCVRGGWLHQLARTRAHARHDHPTLLATDSARQHCLQPLAASVGVTVQCIGLLSGPHATPPRPLGTPGDTPLGLRAAPHSSGRVLNPRHPLADSCQGTNYSCAPLFAVFLGCPRLLRWTNSGDHLRALLRFSMVSVLTPPHQSPFRIKASGAAPERRSSPCPWRAAPQQILGTLPCLCGLQVKRLYAWHCPTRSRRPDGASGRTSGITPTSSQMMGLPGLGATLARAHGRGGGVTYLVSNVADIGPEGGVANQNIRLTANAVYELTPPAVCRGLL